MAARRINKLMHFIWKAMTILFLKNCFRRKLSHQRRAQETICNLSNILPSIIVCLRGIFIILRFLQVEVLRCSLVLHLLLLSQWLLFLNIDLRLLLPKVPLHLILHDPVLNPWLHIFQVRRLLPLATWIPLMYILRRPTEMKLLLRIVRWMWLWRPWCVPRHIVWVCRADVVSGVVTHGEGCSGGSLSECLCSLLQVGVLGWGVLDQEASLVLLVWWAHVLFVGFDIRGVAHMIGWLATSWLVDRWCALAIRSAIPILDTPYRLIISARILWMHHYLRLLLLIMRMLSILFLIPPSVILSKHPLQLCGSLLSLDQSTVERALFICCTDSLPPALFRSSCRSVMMSLLMVLYFLLRVIFLVILTPPRRVDQGVQRAGARLVCL